MMILLGVAVAAAVYYGLLFRHLSRRNACEDCVYRQVHHGQGFCHEPWAAKWMLGMQERYPLDDEARRRLTLFAPTGECCPGFSPRQVPDLPGTPRASEGA